MSDEVLLLDMLIAAREALSFVDGLKETQFAASRLHQWAVVKQIEIIGEAASRVSPDFPANARRHPVEADHWHAASSGA